jgi:hypothetical protein
VISQLVGMAVQTIALKAMDPNAPYGNTGQTVQDQINQVQQQREQLTQRSNEVETLLPRMTEQDWIVYRDRWLMFGEQNAENWIISKYKQN